MAYRMKQGLILLICGIVIFLLNLLYLTYLPYSRIENPLAFWLSFFFLWGGFGVLGTVFEKKNIQYRYLVWGTVGILLIILYYISFYFIELQSIVLSWMGFFTGILLIEVIDFLLPMKILQLFKLVS